MTLEPSSYEDAGVVYNGQLGAYIERDFEPAFGVNGYEFLVHRGRRIAALSTASIRPDPGDPNHSLLSITLGELSTPISSIEIWQTGLSSERLFMLGSETLSRASQKYRRAGVCWRVLTRGADSLRLTPLNEDGTPSGETRSSPWPIRTQNTITLLEGRFDARLPQTRDLFVVVRSAERTIASAPVRP